MKLTQYEIAQPLWGKLVEHYTPIIDKHRLKIENPDMPEKERIASVYHIKFIKEFLALATPELRKEKSAG
jgi:hypothetical protein